MSARRVFKTKVLTHAERQARYVAKKKRKAAEALVLAQRERAAALPILDGMELRIGDARVVLADVPDNSVPLILTGPPYGNDAEPLYKWLARFAARVLIPGGSLICLTGQSMLNRDMAIFDAHLRYWWLHTISHVRGNVMHGKRVVALYKPILHYVKQHRRKVHASPLPDRWPSELDKDWHAWGQGAGGVQVPIEHLTLPGELIVDPFAGSAQWGRVANQMGRRWLGADIAAGGTTTIQRHPPSATAAGRGLS